MTSLMNMKPSERPCTAFTIVDDNNIVYDYVEAVDHALKVRKFLKKKHPDKKFTVIASDNAKVLFLEDEDF